MCQFPLIESKNQLLTKEELPKAVINHVSCINESRVYYQLLTHRKIHAKFFEIEYIDFNTSKDCIFVELAELNKYGFPKIIKDYLSEK